MNFLYKENWDEAREHLEAFWNGEYIDRPLTLLCASGNETISMPVARTLEEKWTDPEYLVKISECKVASVNWMADAMPSYSNMTGWVLNFDFPIEFQEDTIWIEHSLMELDRNIKWEDRWRTKLWDKMLEYTEKVCQNAKGKYFVGAPLILPPNDLLSMLRGPQNFLLDMLDSPSTVKECLSRMTLIHLEMHKILYEIRRNYFKGNLHHFPVWSPEFIGFWQSDMSAMISPDMFKDFIIPELHMASSVYDKIIYHLDGPDSIKHLDHICSVDKVHTIQWEPGAGQPQGAFWLDLYKKIQDCGRVVLATVAEQDLEPIIRELEPSKLILNIYVDSKEEGEKILDKIKNLTKKYHSKGSYKNAAF